MLALAGILPVAARAQTAAVAAALVFEQVTVVDVERGKLLPDQRVVIAGNRIQAVGSVRSVAVPKDAKVVDARGKYLIPGLWDMHVHPGRWVHLFDPLFVANGVTGIRDAGSEVPLDTLILWRREILAGTRVGTPRQILSGQSIIGGYGVCKGRRTNASLQICVADSVDAVRVVASLKAAGADMIKPHEVDRKLYFVIAAEARRLGMPFGGHASNSPSPAPIEAADSGAVLIDHGFGVKACWIRRRDVEQWRRDCEEGAKHFQRTGTWVVPTFAAACAVGGAGACVISAHLTNRTREFWTGTPLRRNWLRDSLDLVVDSSGKMAIAERAGLMILAGTDAGMLHHRFIPPGISLHAELAMFVAEGMTPAEALRTATLNPAKMLRGTDSLGTVAPGKLADLVLLDADPLADIINTTAIRAVVANGRYFDRAALDQLLAEVQTRYKTEGLQKLLP